MQQLFSIICGFIIFTFSFSLPAQNATELVKRADEKMRGTSSATQMTMKVVRPSWSRVYEMKAWSKGTERSLILITAPERDKGVAYLKRDQEIWNWQPSINNVIKLPPSMMMQSWMGSDFTNDDLIRESSIVYDYEHRMAGDTTIDGREAWKIVMDPKPDAPVVWGRVDLYISKKENLQLLARYYDESGELINTLTFSDIREIGGRVIPTQMTMTPADKPQQKTVITYQDIDFNRNFEDDFFSLQNMKRIR